MESPTFSQAIMDPDSFFINSFNTCCWSTNCGSGAVLEIQWWPRRGSPIFYRAYILERGTEDKQVNKPCQVSWSRCKRAILCTSIGQYGTHKCMFIHSHTCTHTTPNTYAHRCHTCRHQWHANSQTLTHAPSHACFFNASFYTVSMLLSQGNPLL